MLYKGEDSEVEVVSMKVIAMESSHIALTCTCMKLVLTSKELQMIWIFAGRTVTKFQFLSTPFNMQLLLNGLLDFTNNCQRNVESLNMLLQSGQWLNDEVHVETINCIQSSSTSINMFLADICSISEVTRMYFHLLISFMQILDLCS